MMTKIKAPASSDDSWTPPGYVHLTALVRQYGISKVRSDLFAKRLQAYWWDQGFGDLNKVEPRYWGSNDAERWLAEGWAIRPNSGRYYSEAPLRCMIVVLVEDEPMEMPDEVMEKVQSLTDEPADEPHARDPKPKPKPTRKSGGGRPGTIEPDQRAKAISLLNSQDGMLPQAARKVLRDNGIEGSDSALNRLIAQAYTLSK